MISVINPNLNLIKFVTWDKLRYGVYRVACFPFAPRTLIQLSLFVGHTKPRTRSYSWCILPLSERYKSLCLFFWANALQAQIPLCEYFKPVAAFSWPFPTVCIIFLLFSEKNCKKKTLIWILFFCYNTKRKIRISLLCWLSYLYSWNSAPGLGISVLCC